MEFGIGLSIGQLTLLHMLQIVCQINFKILFKLVSLPFGGYQHLYVPALVLCRSLHLSIHFFFFLYIPWQHNAPLHLLSEQQYFLQCPFGKNTHITRISNSVPHPQSFKNTAIAENAAPRAGNAVLSVRNLASSTIIMHRVPISLCQVLISQHQISSV